MMQHIQGYPVYGLHDDQTLRQFLDVMSRAEYGALMADGHLGYVMPIGGVAAYRNKVSAVGVGFDIGCGNLAVRLDMHKSELTLDQRCIQPFMVLASHQHTIAIRHWLQPLGVVMAGPDVFDPFID